ncbi:zinc finger protein 77-like isoform X2 [Tribolium madens]|uniref:zinc finger protein 77-like isoform X2 n=1 Tax=Tribolium madens TaxID=41895 RepID=UPI001CF74ECB|nr:zinc finger protein 77-like isoform X2 [Tribolium madens]
MSKRICRLCLAHPSVCYSLLEGSLSDMLETLTSIKVDASDISPNFIKSDEKLKELAILNNVEVKLEVSEVDLVQESTQEMNLIQVGAEIDSLCLSYCIICGDNVAEKTLAKHMREHFAKEQICDICDESFIDLEEYKSHINLKHPQTSHKCPYCDTSFRYKNLYNIHLSQAHKTFDKKRETNDPGGPFTCDVCQKQFTCKRKFKSHSHQRKKCPICDAEITKSNFSKHIMNHSSGPQICELCGATLRSLESLRGHLSHTHSSEIYNCNECGKVFHKRYAYRLHMKKHAGEKTHICESCGKTFLTLFYLNKHVKTAHLKLRPYICKYCNKAFSSKFAMRTHVRQHTNETPYKCEVCGDGFRQNVSLRAHRKSKHNIIEPKNCACTVCGKLFGSEQAIISHMRLH